MEFRTGIDILEIKRIEKSLSNPRFLTRLFGVSEVDQYIRAGSRPSFLAGNFCAKEAFSKTLGTGIRGFALNEVEILRDALGKPYFVFSGKAKDLVEAKNMRFDVSISHDGGMAVASVVAWTEGRENI